MRPTGSTRTLDAALGAAGGSGVRPSPRCSAWQLVPEVGHPAALRATAGVLAVSLILVAAFAAIDRVRGRRKRDARRRTGPAAP